MTREELLEFLIEALGICGCSKEDQIVEFLFDLLEAAEIRSAGLEQEADAVVDDMLPDGDCLERNLPVYWMVSAGLIEHGYALGTFTITDVGKVVLEALRDYGRGEELWEGREGDSERVWN